MYEKIKNSKRFLSGSIVRLSSFAAIFLLFTGLGLGQAHANEGVTGAGDGGHGVVCKDKTGKTKLEFLDLYIARETYGIKADFGFDTSRTFRNFDNQARVKLLKRAFAVARARAAAILGETHPFMSSFDVYADKRISVVIKPYVAKTYDSVFSDQGRCHLVQIAKRVKLSEVSTIVHVNKTLYAYSSVTDQTAIALHEAFHSWFSDFTKTNTAVREAVIFLVAPGAFRKQNTDLFINLVKSRGRLHNGYRKP